MMPSLTGLFATKPDPTTTDPATVIAEMLGREHAGKTGTRAMTFRIPQQGPLPTGLELAALDPRALNKLMNASLATYRSLQKSGLTSTLDTDVVEYMLFHGNNRRALYRLRDSVGQLLTFTDDESDRRMQEAFAKHHENLAAADVLQVVMSCPPDETTESLERWQNDLTVVASNLRVVLSTRPSGRKLAVALVLSKTDGVYPTAEEARAKLTNDRLRAMCHRLVTLLEGSPTVGLAAILPVSAFGYGTARQLPAAVNRGATPQKGFSLLSDGEPEWVLKEGVMPTPHNLTALVWWSLMAGLALKPAANGRGSELARTAELLRADLEAMSAWYVPLQCRPLR